ncbi:MAG TPA: hypothetical protein VG826_20140 [Pirellulales bacterium]|nr:hypothetical protein [Pirellulales bacterium]
MPNVTRMRFDFTVKSGEKKYDCHRMVSGTDVFRQTVYVEGLGSKPDGASYGLGERPVDTMELNAKLIAAELIKQGSPS